MDASPTRMLAVSSFSTRPLGRYREPPFMGIQCSHRAEWNGWGLSKDTDTPLMHGPYIGRWPREAKQVLVAGNLRKLLANFLQHLNDLHW